MSETPVVPLDPHEFLTVPKKRRFMHEMVSTEEGGRELRVFFGLKEISFDDPDEIVFGEKLLQQDKFMAAQATTWTNGAPRAWDTTRALLEQLIAEGIIERGDDASPLPSETATFRNFAAYERERPAPAEPKWWNPDCAPILQEVTGRPLELGYIETVLPVHRLAHPALDADARQVGEMNVFPEAIRMKIPTEWKVCNFPGSRFRDDLPMNVTALQEMIKVWRPMQQAVLACREEFIRRYPSAAQGPTLGDIHALGCAILGLPTFLLMRANDPVPNGTLDPVLSSLFRVTDGVRMVAIYLLFLPEQPMTYDTPMSAAQLHFLTERDNHFLSRRGVCAGPQNMVDEFMATMIEGKALEGETPALGDWARVIPEGVDYGLHGVALYSVIFTLWVRMGHAYQKIREALLANKAPDGEGTLFASVQTDWKVILPGRLSSPVQRAWSEARYTEMLDRAQRGVRGFEEGSQLVLSEALALAPEILGDSAREQLRGILREQWSKELNEGAIHGVADAIHEYLRVERAALRSATVLQKRINHLLRRPNPTRPLNGFDLAIHHRLRARTLGVLPYVMDLLQKRGIAVENSEGATRVTVGEKTIDLS